MKKIIFLILFSTLIFSEEYLKLVLFDKDKNYVKEYENIKEFGLDIFNIKEGFSLGYPDGKPPVAVKFRKDFFEKIYEETNLKKVQFIPKECEYLEKLEGIFKITPEKEWKGFPFDKKYNFILVKNSEFLYLKSGKYFIEDLEGKYLNPNPVPFEFFSNIVLYPSFKTKILIEDGKGAIFENCRIFINYEVKPYGKLCEKIKFSEFIEGNNFYYIFPQEGFANLKIYCPSALSTNLNLKTKEISNPFIINIKRTGKIEGTLTDKKGIPIENYNLVIFKEGEIIPLKETKTDKEGNFLFLDLEDGIYKIKDSDVFKIEKGKNMTFRIRDDAQFMAGFPDGNVIIRDEPNGFYVNEIVELKDGADVFLNIQIEEKKIWEGKVISEDGEPIKGAQFSANYQVFSSTNENGEFKIEFRGKILKDLHIWAEGYAGIYFSEIDLEDPPSRIILKGKGDFKLTIAKTGIENALQKIFDLISFVSEEGELKGELSSNVTQEDIIVKTKLPEGQYYFKIEGSPFKPFISSPFYIEAKKEYDYGRINLELQEAAELPEKKEIIIRIKDFEEKPAPSTNVVILCKSTQDPNFTFSSILISNMEGVVIFKPIEIQFSYLYIFAEGERGFANLGMEELYDFSNLNSFDIKLNPPNELNIKIENIKSKAGKFKMVLRNKYETIIENINKGEDKNFKNLFTPIDLEIWDKDEIIWKEKIHLNAGQNYIIL